MTNIGPSGPKAKSPLRSKTLWVNVLSGAAYLLAEPLRETIPPHVAVPALAGLNLALRLLTTGPIALRSDTESR